MFVSFASSDSGNNFIVDKFGEKGHDYVLRMRAEMDELTVDALHWMKKLRNERGCKELLSFLSTLKN